MHMRLKKMLWIPALDHSHILKFLSITQSLYKRMFQFFKVATINLSDGRDSDFGQFWPI